MSMARPSGFPPPRKEGLRCDNRKQVKLPEKFFSLDLRDMGMIEIQDCLSLLLERHPEYGLGLRCDKKDCQEFHPLDVLLSRAVEEELLGPDQLERIQNAVSASQNSEQVHPELAEREEEMTQEIAADAKHTVEINPPVFVRPYPDDAVQAIRLLETKRKEIWAELLECHFPTFDSGEMQSYANMVIGYVVEGNLDSVDIVAQGDAGHYSVWIEFRFKSGERRIRNTQTSAWSKQNIAMDVAYKIQAFLNLVKVPCTLVDRINTEGTTERV